MKTRTKIMGVLMLLAIVDTVIPIPIIGLILLSVILQKPPWFIDLVKEIYVSE